MGIKILATIGPSSLNRGKISVLEKNGVNLFRINLSHNKVEELIGMIKSKYCSIGFIAKNTKAVFS